MIHSNVKACMKCDVSMTRKMIVNGRSNKRPTIMFIGTSPGMKEDRLGLPFIGKTGIFIRQLCRKFKIEDISYFTYLVKCFNRREQGATEREMSNCFNYIKAEIKVLQPTVTVLLGSVPLNKYYADVGLSIIQYRGKPIYEDNKIIFPMMNPSYVMRPENKKYLKQFVIDFYSLYKLLLKHKLI
jgi:DNA polymerase